MYSVLNILPWLISFAFNSFQEGVTAEIMALAQGHNDIAELLTKLKPVSGTWDLEVKAITFYSSNKCYA